MEQQTQDNIKLEKDDFEGWWWGVATTRGALFSQKNKLKGKTTVIIVDIRTIELEIIFPLKMCKIGENIAKQKKRISGGGMDKNSQHKYIGKKTSIDVEIFYNHRINERKIA